MNNLSKNLLFLRRYYKFTQADMQQHIGVSRVTWSNYENGVSEPDIVRLINISDLFNVKIDDIIRVDLSENVGVIKKNEEMNRSENMYLNVPENVRSLESLTMNEEEVPYQKTVKKEVDLLILTQLNVIAADVKEIKKKLS